MDIARSFQSCEATLIVFLRLFKEAFSWRAPCFLYLLAFSGSFSSLAPGLEDMNSKRKSEELTTTAVLGSGGPGQSAASSLQEQEGFSRRNMKVYSFHHCRRLWSSIILLLMSGLFSRWFDAQF